MSDLREIVVRLSYTLQGITQEETTTVNLATSISSPNDWMPPIAKFISTEFMNEVNANGQTRKASIWFNYRRDGSNVPDKWWEKLHDLCLRNNRYRVHGCVINWPDKDFHFV